MTALAEEKADADLDPLTSATVTVLLDIPPSLRAEWHFIKNVFIVIAASLGGSTRRLCYRVLSMRLFFIPPWGSGHLTY